MASSTPCSFEITIRSLGSSGEGVGSHDGLTVFVEGALPGERVRVRPTLRKPRYLKAELLEILIPSPDRVQPPCPYFGDCGGCQLMHLSYQGQLETKRQRVQDALERIARIAEPNVLPPIPSNPLHYRHKIQLPIRDGAMGLYRRGTHEIIPIERCLIHCERGEAALQAVRENLPEELRHLVIRTAHGTDDLMMILVSRDAPSKRLVELARRLPASGVVHHLNRSQGNRILGSGFTLLAGRDHLREQINGLELRLSPGAFFQVNPRSASQLYRLAIGMAELEREETLLDAYCGVGALALHAASKCRSVLGIEVVPAAIHDAKQNAAINGLNNATFRVGQVERLIGSVERPDVLLLNPPRKGCEPEVLEAIERWRPRRLVYISCDPATLARDLTHLPSYRLQQAQPVDMFPQTAHIETIVQLFSVT